MKKVNGFAPLIENVHIVDFSPIGDKYIKVYANVMGIERSHVVEKVDEWAWRDAYEEDRDKVAQVIGQKMFKVDLTDRDFILKAVDAKLAQCDKLDINRFFSDFADMNLLNPYFGYSEKETNSRGIHNVWARDTAEYINVHSLPRGYGGGVKDFKGKEMTIKQLHGIWCLLDYKCRQREWELNAAKDNKDIEEYWPEFEAWAKTCLESVQHKYAVQLQTGRRAYDKQEYKALVFFENEGGPCNANSQIGHIPIRQDDWGFVWFKQSKPLCGETDERVLEMQNPDAWKKSLKEAVEYMVGCRLTVHEKTEQEKRISDISVYRRTCGGQMTADYMLRCKIDGVQQSGRLVGKESTQIHNLICDRQEGHLARLKLELAQKYFKDVLDNTQQQDKGLRR